MALNVLVIDDNEHFRHLLTRNLLLCRNDANVHEYDPVARGKPDANFNWAAYDLVFLDYKIGNESGVEWLKSFQQRSDYPKTVFLVTDKHLSMGKLACEAGAQGYISKNGLTRAQLRQVIDDIMRPSAQDSAAVDTLEIDFKSVHPTAAIKDYEILEKLSHSHIASIYLGRRPWDTQKRVIKILAVNNMMDERYIDRFLQEYELIEHLKHPNIIRIYDHGITDEYLYMVMEFLPQGNLKDKIEEGLTPLAAVQHLVQVAEGLNEIHSVGVIHRDIKPSNIMFRENEPVIIDFGISKLSNMEVTKTFNGQVVGTPFYMSPEQGAGEDIDFRSDLYSLGVTFYEMLTGDKPYDGDNPLAIVYKHLHAPLPRVPAKLMGYQPLIDGMMAKDPQARFQSANELIKYVSAKYGIHPEIPA